MSKVKPSKPYLTALRDNPLGQKNRGNPITNSTFVQDTVIIEPIVYNLAELNAIVNQTNQIIEQEVQEEAIQTQEEKEETEATEATEEILHEMNDPNINIASLELELNNAVKTLEYTTKVKTTTRNKLRKFSNKLLSEFTEVPSPMEIAVLYIANHGSYDIDNFKYKIVSCPLQELIRLQYAPHGMCAWASNYSSTKEYVYLSNHLGKSGDVIKDKCSILQELSIISERGKTSTLTTKDFYKIQKKKTTTIFEKKLCNNVKKSNKIVENKLGNFLIDKNYSIDSSDDCGIAILFNVTFRLPDIFFSEANQPHLERTLARVTTMSPQYHTGQDDETNEIPYKIGKYHSTGINANKITYEANTELLSCPFFRLFLKLIKFDHNLEYCHSIVDEIEVDSDGYTKMPQDMVELKRGDPISTPRKMIDSVNTESIYKYFQYVGMCVNLDYSCSVFDMFKKDTTKLKKMGKEKAQTFLKKKLGIPKNATILGGKKTRNTRKTQIKNTRKKQTKNTRKKRHTK